MPRRFAFVLLVTGTSAGACDGKSSSPSPTEAVVAADASECVYGHGTGECPHHDASDPPKQVDDDDHGHYGEPFELGSSVSLGEAIANFDAHSAAPVRVEGTITSVCKRKGCWMVVTDGEATARVLFKDYGFTVPTDSESRHAEVEGLLATRTFTPKQAKHLEEDGGGNPQSVTDARTEYVLTATGVRIN